MSTRAVNPPWVSQPKPAKRPRLIVEARDHLHLVGLVRDGEVYGYLFDARNVDAAVSTMGKHAADPSLSLSWPESTVLAVSARESVAYEATKRKLRRWLSDAFRRFWRGR